MLGKKKAKEGADVGKKVTEEATKEVAEERKEVNKDVESLRNKLIKLIRDVHIGNIGRLSGTNINWQTVEYEVEKVLKDYKVEKNDENWQCTPYK